MQIVEGRGSISTGVSEKKFKRVCSIPLEVL